MKDYENEVEATCKTNKEDCMVESKKRKEKVVVE